MIKLVLIRHGESVWNKENLFCGWFDADLSDTGINQAKDGGKWLKDAGFTFDVAYSSVLRRAIKTTDIVLDQLDLLWIPVIKDWRLNERHYGGLTGLNKAETLQKFGEEKFKLWRRSFDVPPPVMEVGSKFDVSKDPRYNGVAIPNTESLKIVIDRVIPFWDQIIVPQLKSGKKVLIGAHGNSLRAMLKFIENIPDSEISELNLPTGVPIVVEFTDDMKFIQRYYVGDEDKINAIIDGVKNQGKK
jgi:2,3-bisphosphoglycerate-dependent phosphoglycerate mutase